MDLLGNTCFLQRVQKVMSVGCLLVDFDPCRLFHFVVIMIDTNFLAMYCYFPVTELVNFVKVVPGIVVAL